MQDKKVDITERFFDSCKRCLGPGDVAHETYFGLQHAMSAIEIMNPSMDVGMRKEREVIFLHESINSGLLLLDTFENKHMLLGIIDELLSSFVNWITGDSIVQTVYTCLYMHCIPIIKDPILSVFCDVFRRCLLYVREILLMFPVFEEEDFCAMTYGVPMNINTSKDFLNNNIENNYFSLSEKSILLVIQKVENELIKSSKSDSIGHALSTRLCFIRNLFEVLFYMKPFTSISSDNESDFNYDHEPNGYGAPVIFSNSSEVPPFISSIKKFHELFTNLLTYSQKLQKLSQQMISTLDLGALPGPGKLTPRTHEYGLLGFEPFLTQSCLPSTVQRSANILDRSLAFPFLVSLFSRINILASELIQVSTANELKYFSFHDIWALLHQFGHNFCQSVSQKNVNDSKPQLVQKSSCLLSRGILNALICAMFQCPPILHKQIKEYLNITQPSIHIFLSWMSVESSKIRSLFSNHVSIFNTYKSFFDHVGSQMLTIARGYCFNRSRQRSNMQRTLSRMHELLEDSCSIENALVISLTEELEKIKTRIKTPISLHLAAYICYFYYHLCWDYVNTGFQLGLYSSLEWIYMYSFVINILRSLSNLLLHMMTSVLQDEQTTPQGIGEMSSGIGMNLVNESNQKVKSSRRRRRKCKETETVTTDSQNNNFSDPCSCLWNSSAMPATYWKYQVALTNVHRFVCAGTIYIIRAFQRELNIDLSLYSRSSRKLPVSLERRKFYGSLRTQFVHRLGVIVSCPTSPLADTGGALATFKSTHEYLISSHFVNCSISELYVLASRIFAVARQWIKNADEALNTLNAAKNWSLLPIGPCDSLLDLDHLAKNNNVVSKLLAVRPEKRPSASQVSTNKLPDLLSPDLSVKLDFDYLPSKLYPLIRLVS